MIAVEYRGNGGWATGSMENGGWSAAAMEDAGWSGFSPTSRVAAVSERLQLRRERTNERLTSLKTLWDNEKRTDARLRVWNYASQRPVVWKNAFAAAAAGTALTMTTFPLSTIKTQMQAGLHSSFIGCVLSFVQKHGVRKLYSGVSIDLIQNLPYSFLYVGTFETLKSIGLPRPFAAAAGSAASCIVTVPADMVTQRMQVASVEHGYRTQWTVFENLKDLLERRRGGRRLTTCESLMVGGISGCASALFTCPIDVVKTRLQTNINYRGVAHALEHIVAHEGIGAVYAGLVPRTLLVFPTTAIFFCVYEHAKQLLYSKTAQLQMMPLETKGGRLPKRTFRRRAGTLSLREKLEEKGMQLKSKILPPLCLPLLSFGTQCDDGRAHVSAVGEGGCLQVGLSCRQQGSPSSP
ncbi:hypothetical protein CBR_g49357 [Chara braunii]|uniref:Uncharacterized protein n=1 Tax=Chara braunii TaxID=69332 RepID=A0A388M4R1_CHABU|nr:hypothetical protein CBR_g49357 [Chara braunii]|eukprot:GBG89568.1 hypothetical protein CBR_g49357 [Chara braunii]